VSSRKDEKEQRRQERLAREQAESAAARRRRRYGIIVGTILGVAALAAIGVVIAAGGGDDSGTSGGNAEDTFPNAVAPPAVKETDLIRAAEAAGCKLSNPPIEGRNHIDDSDKVTYKTTPPTSGNHNPIPAEDGYYPVKPNVRNSVHTLEHGRIYVHYKPTIRQRRIAQLGGLFNEDPFHMVLSPDPNMPYAVAVTAWGHLAGCKRVTDDTFDVIRAFRDRYRDRGPEAAP
jgi:hypothetical protein